MKKFVVALCVTFCLCSVALTNFAQAAFAADRHAYVTIEHVHCGATPGDKELYLTWKSKDFVPSPPEANEDSRIWPEESDNPPYWRCRNGETVSPVYEKKFPVDLTMKVTLWDDDRLGGGEDNIDDSLGSEDLVPIENVTGSLHFKDGAAVDYLVTFHS